MSKETGYSASVEQLPLEWTRIKRTSPSSNTKKRARQLTWEDDDDGLVVCCTNIFCPTRKERTNIVPAPTCDSPSVLSGMALFCLTDPDCDWFQGYFFMTDQAYYGLLCLVKQDIDECLQCSEGGYREISMQMSPLKLPGIHKSNRLSSESIDIPRILWTGGDMMKLATSLSSPPVKVATDDASILKSAQILMNRTPSSEINVRMRATNLYTGKVARIYIQKYFSSLLRHIKSAHTENGATDLASVDGKGSNDRGIEDIMPNAAIVSGTMDVWF